LITIQHSESSTPTGHKIVGVGSVSFERNIPESVKKQLADMGHKIDNNIDAFGG